MKKVTSFRFREKNRIRKARTIWHDTRFQESDDPVISCRQSGSRDIVVFPAFLDCLVSSRSRDSAGKRRAVRGYGAARTTGKTRSARYTGKSRSTWHDARSPNFSSEISCRSFGSRDIVVFLELLEFIVSPRSLLRQSRELPVVRNQ